MKPMHIMQKCMTVELWVMLNRAIVIVKVHVIMKITLHEIIIFSDSTENTNKKVLNLIIEQIFFDNLKVQINQNL